MSIGYSNLYNITAGIFMAFSNKKVKERVLSVNHPQKKRDKVEKYFPINKYNLSTKENFVLVNLYINFKEGVSSFEGVIQKLNELDGTTDKRVLDFKNKIINYRKFLKDDIERIQLEETSIDLDYMISEYRNNKIQWYTFYFYLEALDDTELVIEKLKKSRINGKLIDKIQKLMLYVSFSEKSKNIIKVLMKDSIAIG
jgi:hypothetical protein